MTFILILLGIIGCSPDLERHQLDLEWKGIAVRLKSGGLCMTTTHLWDYAEPLQVGAEWFDGLGRLRSDYFYTYQLQKGCDK